MAAHWQQPVSGHKIEALASHVVSTAPCEPGYRTAGCITAASPPAARLVPAADLQAGLSRHRGVGAQTLGVLAADGEAAGRGDEYHGEFVSSNAGNWAAKTEGSRTFSFVDTKTIRADQ